MVYMTKQQLENLKIAIEAEMKQYQPTLESLGNLNIKHAEALLRMHSNNVWVKLLLAAVLSTVNTELAKEE